MKAFLIFFILFSSYPVYSATFVVNTTADTSDALPGDGVCLDAFAKCSLRAAIATSNEQAASNTISFSVPAPVSITLILGRLTINSGLTISPPDSRNLTITQTTPNSAVFYVDSASNVTFNRMTISGGLQAAQPGGGIVHYGSGTLNLNSVVLINNRAPEGGGLANPGGPLNISDCTIANNTGLGGNETNGSAGGISLRTTATVNITRSTISGNWSKSAGGGIYIIDSPSVTITNSTITGNTASGSGSGAGIYSSRSTISVINGTIGRNTGKGGIYNLSSVVILRNSIVNAAGGIDLYGTFVTRGNNLIGDPGTATGIIHGMNGDIVGVADPKLAPLSDNGGVTQTQTLLPGSPAINAGNNCVSTASCSSDNPPQALTFDQRSTGFSRKKGLSVDIGAFEVQEADPPVVSINSVTASEGDAGVKILTFTVTLSSSFSQSVTVNYATANGTAAAGSDYQSAGGQLVFSSGEVSKNVQVSINGDQVIESNETFTVNLSNPVNGTITNGVGNATIQNDDVAGSFRFTAPTYTANENGSLANITVTRTGGAGSGASVLYATQNGTATSGSDYLSATGTLTFAANESQKSFTIPILADSVVDPNETINIQISSPTLGGTLGTPAAAVLTIVEGPAPRRSTPFDFDGDGRADISVVRSSTNRWYELMSSTGAVYEENFGLAGDIVAPADFDGDGKTDEAIFRPSDAQWWYRSSVNGALIANPFGESGDIPLPSDFDGDGRADQVVFHPWNNTWRRLSSITELEVTPVVFGQAGDQPLVGDFDGDGKSDLAIFRPSNGDWWYAASSLGGAFRNIHWGQTGDLPVAADFDGDGRTDCAVFRPSDGGWYILNSSNGSFTILAFGTNGDRPVPADYDGDGRADIAVFRPSTGIWYLMQSTSGSAGLQFGISSDQPMPNVFVP